jgi:tetratricopeptide (TPR) repeat protein
MSSDSAFPLSTENDSTLYYYNLGWQQIMDEGRYGKAEESYRKALDHDPDFLIGKSVLARLTLDTSEQLQLFRDIEDQKVKIQGDERLILDVYTGLTEFTIIRNTAPEKASAFLRQVLAIAEDNLRTIVHKYPDEVYLKSEYIEVLHSLYGTESALDSLDRIILDTQKSNPFLLGFSATLEAESGNYEKALLNAKKLESVINDRNAPKPYAVFADIYFQMDSLELAKKNADKAVLLDPRNLDASRLKDKIDARLSRASKPK